MFAYWLSIAPKPVLQDKGGLIPAAIRCLQKLIYLTYKIVTILLCGALFAIVVLNVVWFYVSFLVLSFPFYCSPSTLALLAGYGMVVWVLAELFIPVETPIVCRVWSVALSARLLPGVLLTLVQTGCTCFWALSKVIWACCSIRFWWHVVVVALSTHITANGEFETVLCTK